MKFIKIILVLHVVVTSSCSFNLVGKIENPVNVGIQWQSYNYQGEVLGTKNIYLEGRGTVYVDYSDERQIIDGFGGSNAWTSLPSDSSISNRIVELLYSTSKGIGLSILRNRVPFRELNKNGHDDNFVAKESGEYIYTVNSLGAKIFDLNWSTWDLQNTKKLISKIGQLEKGPEKLTVMSTPWTPPNNSISSWKKNVPDIDNWPEVGGYLDPDHYNDYGDLLADYVNGFKTNMGVELTALSIQNEPTWEPSYESCLWDSGQIKNFLITLGSRFYKKNVSENLSIIAAEDENFEEDMVLPSINSPLATRVFSIVGIHQYNNGNENHMASKDLPVTRRSGKKIWMTEVSSGDINDESINDGLYWAELIHYDLTITEINAFLYWWLWNNSSYATKSSLISISNSIIKENKRLYAIGQYSRYIRPGWRRVGSTTEPLKNIFTSAYKGPESGEIAIVMVNKSSSTETISMEISGITGFTELYRSRTSATENLVDLQPISTTEGEGNVQVELIPRSITTVWGRVVK